LNHLLIFLEDFDFSDFTFDYILNQCEFLFQILQTIQNGISKRISGIWKRTSRDLKENSESINEFQEFESIQKPSEGSIFERENEK
jgi:hypothetical protein